MNLKKTILLLLILLTSTQAWYPDYSVMVTDFVVPVEFLAPTRMQSIGLQSLGLQFGRIYSNPLDNAFQNPAYLNFQETDYLYLDVAGSGNVESYQDTYNMPGYGYLEYDAYRPYYWSPYRQMTEPEEEEPIAKLIYLGKPVQLLPIRLGVTAEYFYKRQEFYQPIWYGWGWQYKDAVGEGYATTILDPYSDYRIVESGENLQDEQGYRASAFFAMPLLPALSIGARLTILDKKIDGKYTDIDFRDDNYRANDYLSYSDMRKSRQQSFDQIDLSVGILAKTSPDFNLGIMAGYTQGTIDRSLIESDTSNNYSKYYYEPDTVKHNLYENNGAYASDKNWLYDGSTKYGEIHGDVKISDGLDIRLSVFGQTRLADLDESEIMNRRSFYSSHYWNSYDSLFHDYESDSWARLARSGTGNYEFNNFRVSIGANWQLSDVIQFIGGVVFEQQIDNMTADEPFTGEKYSHYSDNWYNSFYTTISQYDDKRFSWWREKSLATIAVPTGVIIKMGPGVEVNLGLTKYIRNTDVEEGYDLVVYTDREIKIIDGIEIENSDSSYVDGHIFPGIHTFTDEYRMNAGISFKYKDSFKITAALRESILEPRSFKIGAEFRW